MNAEHEGKTPAASLDSDVLSEILKNRDARIRERALDYLAAHGAFTFSIITRYEILRGLKAKQARAQTAAFEARCRASAVLPLSDEIIEVASDIYAKLHRTGHLISDADILIAATAQVHRLVLVTNNTSHFGRIGGLTIESWRDG